MKRVNILCGNCLKFHAYLRHSSYLIGLIVHTRENSTTTFVHAPAIVADMPAKAMVRNAIKFNGKFGCSLCTMEGLTVPSGAGHAWAYIRQPNEDVQLRNHVDTLQHAELAHLKKISVKGYWTIVSFVDTVDSLISWQSRDSISTGLCHFIQIKSPNDEGGATIEVESRDFQDVRDFTVATTLQIW